MRLPISPPEFVTDAYVRACFNARVDGEPVPPLAPPDCVASAPSLSSKPFSCAPSGGALSPSKPSGDPS